MKYQEENWMQKKVIAINTLSKSVMVYSFNIVIKTLTEIKKKDKY